MRSNSTMKTAIVILVLLVLGLGAALVYQYRTGEQRLEFAETSAVRWSNRWHESQSTLSVAGQTSARFKSAVRLRETQLTMTSNELAQATNDLASRTEVMADMQAELDASADELWDRDSQIIALKSRQRELQQQLDTAQAAGHKLQKQLAEADRQLGAGTNALLLSQKQLQQQERTVAALNVERELMLQRIEQLEADGRKATAELEEARKNLAAIQTRLLPADRSDGQPLVEALGKRFTNLEKEQARLQAQWQDLAALRAQLVALESNPGTNDSMPLKGEENRP